MNNLNNLLGNLNCKKLKDRTKNKTNFLVCIRRERDTYIMILMITIIMLYQYSTIQ